jgi:energy-converting hydrogenase Eha subunit E
LIVILISETAMRPFQDLNQAFPSKTGPKGTLASQPLVPVYRVGELFRQGWQTWPAGAHFAFGPAGHELTLFYSEIDDDIVNEVRRGDAEFALIVEPPVIVLAYRFGRSISWNDVPYSWHLQPERQQLIPGVDHLPEQRSLLWISLVGADDGIIYAQRGMTLSPDFTRALNEAIRDQALSVFNPEECTSAISRIFLAYPSTVERLTLAAAQTLGNT